MQAGLGDQARSVRTVKPTALWQEIEALNLDASNILFLFGSAFRWLDHTLIKVYKELVEKSQKLIIFSKGI